MKRRRSSADRRTRSRHACWRRGESGGARATDFRLAFRRRRPAVFTREVGQEGRHGRGRAETARGRGLRLTEQTPCPPLSLDTWTLVTFCKVHPGEPWTLLDTLAELWRELRMSPDASTALFDAAAVELVENLLQHMRPRMAHVFLRVTE